MAVFGFERSRAAYTADFVVCGGALLLLAVNAAFETPPHRRPEALVLMASGFGTWSLLEYLLHRFILHGVRPFQSWHEAHHERPAALLGTPTWISASLIFGLVFVPVWQWAALWMACAFTAGVLCGYLNYSFVHHAVHHWPAHSARGQRLKLWHARHHHGKDPAAVCFGVTSTIWDRAFGSAQRPVARGAPSHEAP